MDDFKRSQLITNAFLPVGCTLYVWGGGWNGADTGAGEGAKTIGISPFWQTYYSACRAGYDFSPGKALWQKGQRQQRLYGLDCAGYIGWLVYNTFPEKREESGIVTAAEQLAERYAALGWGTCLVMDDEVVLQPGDLVSCEGHVWLSLGTCPDGSDLLLHSTANGGVQLSGLLGRDGENREACRMAAGFMRVCYPDWWQQFGAERTYERPISYRNGVMFRWN